MGQSLNTTGLLLAYNKNWLSKWYSEKNNLDLIHEDILIRKYVSSVFRNIGLLYSKCIIRRALIGIYIHINVYAKERTKKVAINRREIKQIISSLTQLTNNKVILIIKPTDIFDAQLMAQYIARKIEKRISFNGIFSRVVSNIKSLNTIAVKEKQNTFIKGIRVQCSGRPNGNDMAYIQWFKYGQTPLHTYDSDIDYAHATALTKYGICGIKVWILFDTN